MALKWVSMPILQRTICSATCKSTISAVLMKNMSSSVASTTTNIGFIGLGNMGGHMARNLIKKVGSTKHLLVDIQHFPTASRSLQCNYLPSVTSLRNNFCISFKTNHSVNCSKE